MPIPQTGLKLAVLALAVALTGLPVNHVAAYALLAVAALAIFTGVVRTDIKTWGLAAVIGVAAIGAQGLLSAPRIDEGFNVFLPGGALERDLPPDVYRHLSAEFDKQYPPDKRCDAAVTGCWRNMPAPDRAFAFSADGIFHKSDMSRAVPSLNFHNEVWHRLGFINELKLNWFPSSDVQRARRDGRFWKGYDRWQLTMPWFAMVRLPAAYAGGRLCWRGDVLMEGADGSFAPLGASPDEHCRIITPADAGKRIVGVAIKPETLSLRLQGPVELRLMQWAKLLIKFIAVIGVVIVLVRVEPRRAIVPASLLGLAALAIAIDDASFLGGVRPFDGGDDGIFYDSIGRDILQKLLAGDWCGFLQGGESVFYYGGPGLRYFRALEHIVFGDSYLGYLTLVLALPLIVLALFRRFLGDRWELVLAFAFVAIPLGTVFGTTFTDYSKWAARGFADPAAYIFMLAGLVVLVGTKESGPRDAFWPSFFAALLIVIGVAMKPLVVVAAFILLAAAWLWAAIAHQWRRVMGLSLGALPVLSMAWHNWVFGGRFVLFSDNAGHPLVLVMPPSAWLAALRELVTFDFAGGFAHRALLQIPNWLSGPSESWATAPVNAAGVAMLIYVVARGRSFDPWLRIVGAAALAQHVVALFYIATARYHLLTWFLTLLLAAAYVQQIGWPWFERRFPASAGRLTGGLGWRRDGAAGVD